MNDKRKRPRFLTTGFVVSGLLALSLIGVAPLSASVTASGRVSAHLTKKSFSAAQAKKVKLVCKFSSKSERFGYVLSRKNGTKWQKLRSVNKTGSFSGTRKMTVKKLFGSKPVKVGRYRVKISADANSVTRAFSVKKASASGDRSGGGDGDDGTTPPVPAPGAFAKVAPANAALEQLTTAALSWGSSSGVARYEYCIDTTNDNACSGSWVSTGTNTSASPSGLTPGTTYYWQVRAENGSGETYSNSGAWWNFTTWKPKAGTWTSSSGASFTVSSDQSTVDPFTDIFSTGGCFAFVFAHDLSIVNGQFSQTGSFYIDGTFDTPTTAHGTDGLDHFSGCGGYLTGGPFAWTATWESS